MMTLIFIIIDCVELTLNINDSNLRGKNDYVYIYKKKKGTISFYSVGEETKTNVNGTDEI